MQERLTHMVGAIAHDVWLGTFHRIGLRILRRYGDLVGLNKNFIVFCRFLMYTEKNGRSVIMKNLFKNFLLAFGLVLILEQYGE